MNEISWGLILKYIIFLFVCYSLERDNAMLIGQYTKKAAEMQNEVIDLPDNVEVSLIYYYYL